MTDAYKEGYSDGYSEGYDEGQENASDGEFDNGYDTGFLDARNGMVDDLRHRFLTMHEPSWFKRTPEFLAGFEAAIEELGDIIEQG